MNKWNFSGTKSQGRSHISNNLPCQDDYLITEKDNISVIALSDGCGSSPISQIGSEITVKTLTTILTEKFDEYFSLDLDELKLEITNELIKELKVGCKKNKKAITELISSNSKFANYKNNEELILTLFDATVQFVACKGNKILVGRLGDGLILCIKNNKLMILSTEDKYKLQENETYYPSIIDRLYKSKPEVLNNFEIIRIEDGFNYSGFLVSSDGLEHVLINSENTKKYCNPERVEAVFKSQNLKDLIELEYKKYRGITDDLSVALMITDDYFVDGYVVRNYDNVGHTTANDFVVNMTIENPFEDIFQAEHKKVKESKTLLKALFGDQDEIAKKKYEISEELQSKINSLIGFENFKKAEVYFKNEEFRLYFYDITCKIIEYIKDKLNNEPITFSDIKSVFSAFVDDLDLKILLKYWEVTKFLQFDREKEQVFIGLLNE